jgi:hypothetical protein
VLAPAAVVAQGEVARLLARRLLALDDAALARLQGVSGEGVLLVLGEEAVLPWVPGVLYLGREPEAASLLLPTTLGTVMPAALLERALLQRFPQLGAPLAVLPGSRQVLSAFLARPLSRELLQERFGGEA